LLEHDGNNEIGAASEVVQGPSIVQSNECSLQKDQTSSEFLKLKEAGEKTIQEAKGEEGDDEEIGILKSFSEKTDFIFR